jgi:hypothetical protein
VLQRYGKAAREVETCLCVPVSYDQVLLRVIPQKIIEKDYGCGDPSRYDCYACTAGSGSSCGGALV